ncbi:MAG: hypothetical protein COX96_00780, partial [Candidatus Omnitrophica bacterium CG_4_10_14_0_2_um_filter_44_9]
MDLKTLTSTVMEIAEDKGIPQEKVLEIISEAIAAAYKKDYGKKKQKVIAQLDPKTGEAKFWQVKLVVDEKMILEEPIEKVKATKKETKKKQTKTKKPSSTETIENKEKIHFNPERHITLEEAKKIEPKIKVGEEIKFPLKAEEVYGRIAAQTAKQVILQKLKEAEREEILKEYQSKEGEAISGIVQRIEQNAIFLDIGRTSAILPKTEQVPNEFYRPGQRLKLYVLKI